MRIPRKRRRRAEKAPVASSNRFAGIWRRPWGVIEEPSHLHHEVFHDSWHDWDVVTDDVGIVSVSRKR